MLKELYVGKIIHFLPIIVSKKLEANVSIEEVKKLILTIYEILDPTKDQDILKSIQARFEHIRPNILRDSLLKQVIRFNYILPPFNAPNFNAIKSAAKLLEIPLNEKVYIPETKTWTKTPVPVGYSYYSAMEQLSADYESTRSTAGYQSSTSQPTVN
jgi:DNA-directed RNA polymerase beta subunit